MDRGTSTKFIILHVPNSSKAPFDYENYVCETMETLRDLIKKKPKFPVMLDTSGFEDETKEISYDISKGRSQLLPWADTVNGDIFFRDTTGEDANQWTVVVYQRDLGEWSSFDCSMSRFLIEVMAGEHNFLFPKNFPTSNPEFSQNW